MMAAKRSRTGCQTCRSRKLKCDEIRPKCGQCTKSDRICVASEGIAFRHEQNASMNASMNAEGSGMESLQNFFKYRNLFNEEQLGNFLPVPKELKFVHITDPFSEEQNPGNPPTSPGSYQQVAAHSLEALSTAATDHPTYGNQNNFGDYTTAFTAGNSGRSGYGPAGSSLGPGTLHGNNNQNNGINFLLNPSNIDPSLEASLDNQLDSQDVHHLDTTHDKDQHGHDGTKENEDDEPGDIRLAVLLRNASKAHEIAAA